MTSASTDVQCRPVARRGSTASANLFRHRRATWREALDGSAALLASCFGAAAVAALLVRFSRHRRTAS